jgi:two-component system nitrogen regulation sensor histidine kinase NtrY
LTEADNIEKGRNVRTAGRRILPRLGPFLVAFALASALASFFILAGLTTVAPTNEVVLGLLISDVVAVLLLVVIVVAEGWTLLSAWREGAAAARLHLRIVKLFSIIAAVPAIVMAVVGAITIDRAISPAFMEDVHTFIFSTATAAQFFRQSQCHSLLQEANLSASDLDRAKPMFDVDRALFHDFFLNRAKFLGFTLAALVRENGEVIDQVNIPVEGQAKIGITKPEPGDFEDARKNEPTCLIADDGKAFVALRELRAYSGAYLYVARPVDPFTMEFPQQASNLIAIYNGFETHRHNILLAFAIMFGLLALIMLLSAVWLGLSFANRLVAPIRRLIAATDQVAAGNLYVRVPLDRTEGDLSHLGDTFNNMTTELRLQQNRLLAANRVNDARRVFTEAVLSGVPAAVVGIDPRGNVSVLNASAERLVAPGEPPIGRPAMHVFPELATILQEAASHQRPVQSQIALVRNGAERTLTVRVTSTHTESEGRSFVATLDDITDLVTAQRTSAWADVARRIAHEIKNPLTPIQLSAERLKRKYSRVITQDRDVFDQCTDTIVRQVDDIKRMVDEFASFARMPKARPEEDDLVPCVREVVFLMRVGHPTVTIEEHLPDTPLVTKFDRRLISQALTNVIKNAAEGIAALEDESLPGRIDVDLSVSEDHDVFIDVTDNGKGFPIENRQRLLEPYVTTRSEGTGLGLPIVAKILEDHGGRLELLDAPGHRGARVRFVLPLEQKPAEAGARVSISQAD